MFSEFKSWIFYLCVFCGSAFLLGFVRQNQRKRTFFAVVITLAALALPVFVAAYRSCGSDTFGYMRYYITTRRTAWEDVLENLELFSESGHALLTKFLTVFKSVRVYFGAYALITLGFYYFATKNFKDDSLPLAMLLFYLGTFIGSFNIMRQPIAIVIVAFSYRYVFERDFKKFIILVLIASTFHTSALISVFAYFIWTKKDKPIPTLFLLGLLMGIVLISINIDFILGSLSSYEFESESLQRYMGYGGATEEEFKNRDFYLNLLLMVIMMVHYTRLVKVDQKNSFFIILFYISVALSLCGFINPYAKRIATYFGITAGWVLVDIPKCYKDHFSVWTARFLVILYAVLKFTITSYILGQGQNIPYVWILPYWARF